MCVSMYHFFICQFCRCNNALEKSEQCQVKSMCLICMEDKNLVKMSCGHECCQECINLSAKGRAESLMDHDQETFHEIIKKLNQEEKVEVSEILEIGEDFLDDEEEENFSSIDHLRFRFNFYEIRGLVYHDNITEDWQSIGYQSYQDCLNDCEKLAQEFNVIIKDGSRPRRGRRGRRHR